MVLTEPLETIIYALRVSEGRNKEREGERERESNDGRSVKAIPEKFTIAKEKQENNNYCILVSEG